MCGERTGAVVPWQPSHHPSGCCTLVVVEERPPTWLQNRFGCTTIHKKRYINASFILFITLSCYIEMEIVQTVDLLEVEFIVKASGDRSFHHSMTIIPSFSMISAVVVMMMRNGICVMIICLKSEHELTLQESRSVCFLLMTRKRVNLLKMICFIYLYIVQAKLIVLSRSTSPYYSRLMNC